MKFLQLTYLVIAASKVPLCCKSPQPHLSTHPFSVGLFNSRMFLMGAAAGGCWSFCLHTAAAVAINAGQWGWGQE